MNAELMPFPALPESLRGCVSDECRTVFLRQENDSNGPQCPVVAVKTQQASPGLLALAHRVDNDTYQSLVDLHRRFVHCRGAPSTPDCGSSAFTSPCLLNCARVHPIAFPRGVPSIVHEDSRFSSVDDVPVASEVHVQFCGGAQVDDDTDVALRTYFSRPRFVSVGWVFGIPASPDNESLFRNRHVPRRLSYFRVVAINPQPQQELHLYQCSAADTALVLDAGRAICHLPALLEVCSSSAPQASFQGSICGDDQWSPCAPPGLNAKVEALQNAIIPAFSSSSLPKNIRSRCHVLLTGGAGSGKKSVVRSCCRWLGVSLFEVSCYALQADTVPAGEVKLNTVFETARKRRPCVLYFRHAELLTRRKDSSDEELRLGAAFKTQLESFAELDDSVVVICSCLKASRLAMSIAQLFHLKVVMEPPSADDRLAVLEDMIANHTLEDDVQLKSIADSVQGAVLGDLCALASRAVQCSLARVFRDCSPLDDPACVTVPDSTPRLASEDWNNAIKQFEQTRSKELGAPKVPEVRWEDVGGLSDVRQEILDTIQLPLEHPELFAGGLKRSGILLYGPPGCGKTLLAKAVATECALNFLSVKGPELLNMYVGQSEENIREVFTKARSAAPCVIFFDELDALAPNRGRSGDSGGVSDRIVAQLLTELDGVGSESNVFVIGATNRPDLIEPALLRPGRFDCRVYVGVYTDRRSQLSVLTALTRKFQLDNDVRLEEIVATFPSFVSGADVSSVCSDAAMAAAQRLIKSIEEDARTVQDTDALVIQHADFLQASRQLVPSVSPEDVAVYEAMKTRK